MYPLDVTMPQAGCCTAGVRGRIDPRIDTVRGNRPASASGLFVSLPFRHAIARLVPRVCAILPPRSGGLHARLSHCIVRYAMAKQLPLS